MIVGIMSVSIILQLLAAGLALWILRTTKRGAGWIFVSLALVLMALRRSITMFRILSHDIANPPDLTAELVALTISILMVAGVGRLFPVLRLINETNAALRRSNRAFRAISLCNHVIVRASRMETLMDEVCRVIVEEGGYLLAWVGFAEHDEERSVRPVAQWGFEDGYLETIKITWAETERGMGPSGRAIRTRKPEVAKNIAMDPLFAPWREDAAKRGYSSSIALPLLVEQELLGILNVYASEPESFDEDEVKLLMGLADDLAYGIAALHARDEQRKSENEIRKQVQRLRSMTKINETIAGILDPALVLELVLKQALLHLNLDAVDILVLDNDSQYLNFAFGLGFKTDALRHTDLRIGKGLAGVAAAEGRVVTILDLTSGTALMEEAPLLKDEGFITYYGVPLKAKGRLIGVLEGFMRSEGSREPEWLDFMLTLAQQAAVAIDNSQLFDGMLKSQQELLEAYDNTLFALSLTLEMRDFETKGHSQRVSDLAERLGASLSITGEDLTNVRRGALMHDIGKLAIPDSILTKPGPLSDEEWSIMRQHPKFAYDVLSPIQFLKPALEIPYCHHEKWDGTGYPRGLEGEAIPLAARVFAVVDVWDALNSDRPYRPAWPPEMVLGYMQGESGKHFDPHVVDVFLSAVIKTQSH